MGDSVQGDFHEIVVEVPGRVRHTGSIRGHRWIAQRALRRHQWKEVARLRIEPLEAGPRSRHRRPCHHREARVHPPRHIQPAFNGVRPDALVPERDTVDLCRARGKNEEFRRIRGPRQASGRDQMQQRERFKSHRFGAGWVGEKQPVHAPSAGRVLDHPENREPLAVPRERRGEKLHVVFERRRGVSPGSRHRPHARIQVGGSRIVKDAGAIG